MTFCFSPTFVFQGLITMSRRTSLATPDELRSALELHSDDQSIPKVPSNDQNSRFYIKAIPYSSSIILALCFK